MSRTDFKSNLGVPLRKTVEDLNKLPPCGIIPSEEIFEFRDYLSIFVPG